MFTQARADARRTQVIAEQLEHLLKWQWNLADCCCCFWGLQLALSDRQSVAAAAETRSSVSGCLVPWQQRVSGAPARTLCIHRCSAGLVWCMPVLFLKKNSIWRHLLFATYGYLSVYLKRKHLKYWHRRRLLWISVSPSVQIQMQCNRLVSSRKCVVLLKVQIYSKMIYSDCFLTHSAAYLKNKNEQNKICVSQAKLQKAALYYVTRGTYTLNLGFLPFQMNYSSHQAKNPCCQE